MSNKWVKAFALVACLWLIVVAGGSLIINGVTQLLPNFINFGGFGHQEETRDQATHNSTGLTGVVIETRNGTVKLVGSDSTEIVVESIYRAGGSSTFDAKQNVGTLGTIFREENNELRIIGDYDKQRSINNQLISFVVTMPRQLLAKVETSNGAVEVEQLSGSVEARTSNGRITITSDSGPSQVYARTSNGTITVDANPSGGSYRLETSNGKVEVKLPDSLGIKLNASTSNGSIDVGSGQWSIEGGRITNKQVDATRGDGALDLRISTSNGSISIEKR